MESVFRATKENSFSPASHGSSSLAGEGLFLACLLCFSGKQLVRNVVFDKSRQSLPLYCKSQHSPTGGLAWSALQQSVPYCSPLTLIFPFCQKPLAQA